MKQIITLLLLFAVRGLQAQETASIEVRQFEYVYEKTATNSGSIVLLNNDSAKAKLKNSFIKAINNKWRQELSDLPLVVKRLPVLATSPKFKTNLDDKHPDKQYLFLQIFDAAIQTVSVTENSRSATWRIKYRLINGKDNSTISDRGLSIDFIREPPAAGQLIVPNFPAYPDEYYHAFDSVASWTINDISSNSYTLKLKQACVFNNENDSSFALKTITFKNDQDKITYEGDSAFTLLQSTNTKELKTKRNVAGNSAAGAVTLLTGLQTNKRKTVNHTVEYSFNDNNLQFHCYVDYTEVYAAQRERINNDGWKSTKTGDFSFIGRYTDTSDKQVLLRDKDTIAWFNIQRYKEQKKYTQMWDGENPATISQMSFEWKNVYNDSEVMLTGEIEGIPFTMYTTNATRKKWFTFNKQVVALINGYDKPVSGTIYQPLSVMQLKLIAILSKLPYSFLNPDPEI